MRVEVNPLPYILQSIGCNAINGYPRVLLKAGLKEEAGFVILATPE
jgi:hypothetical protein